jgi:hypothetical protein
MILSIEEVDTVMASLEATAGITLANIQQIPLDLSSASGAGDLL